MRPEPLVAGVDCLLEGLERPAEVGAAKALRDADRRHEVDASRVAWREKGDGARNELDRSRCVGPDEGASSGDPEPLGRPAGKRTTRLVDRAELRAIAVRLLEVVPEDLLELDRPHTRLLLEPVRETLVHRGPRLLGDRVVGGVPNEEMAEPVGA